MKTNHYFVEAAHSDKASIFHEETKKFFKVLSDSFSTMDEDTLAEIAKIAKKYSLLMQDSGDYLLFRYFGVIAEYAYTLGQSIESLYAISEDEYQRIEIPDPEELHSPIQELYAEVIARIFAAEHGINIDEAKVMLSLSANFQIDLDFHF